MMAKIIKKLNPEESINAAIAVYDIENSNDINKAFEDSKVSDYFQFSNSSAQRFTSKTGAFEFKTKTGFGVIAKGKKGSDFENDAILVCRGTASLYDWLTDFNTGLQTSRTGHAVHAGFNRTFNEFYPMLRDFITVNKPATLHCVGHSLGGALATMATGLAVKMKTKSALYTFGAPRVGLIDFASKLSLSHYVGTDNIHRVFHGGDPVSMVSIWPFVHAPQPGGECHIGKVFEFNPLQHLSGNYETSLAGKTSWNALRKPQPSWDSQIRDWVNSGDELTHFGFNYQNLCLIMRAIQVGIKDCLHIPFASLNQTVVTGTTYLDQISFFLEQASKVSTTSDSFVKGILLRIAKMTGLAMALPQKITHHVVRTVLNHLVYVIGRSVKFALQHTK